MLWLAGLISVALSCELIQLPNSIYDFTPSFKHTNHLEGSGRFFAPQEKVKWEFQVQEDSWFRALIEPKLHYSNICLVKEGTVFDYQDAEVNNFGMLSVKLTPGTYSLEIETLKFEEQADSLNTWACEEPNLYLSLAIHSYSDLESLLPDDMEEYQPGYPEIDPQTIFQDLLPFTTTHAKYYVESATVPLENSILKRFKFENPEPDPELKTLGFTGVWKLTFSMHYDFLLSGGLGILFSKSSKSPSDMSSLKCIKQGSCVFGSHIDKNAVTIYTAFTAGEFEVSIYYSGMTSAERDMLSRVSGKIPFTLHVSLEPLVEREDRFNCEAGHIPFSLNSPGLMDSRGFLRFEDRVIADLRSPKQVSEFKVSTLSFLRVVSTEPLGIDLSIKLRDQENQLVVASEVMGGTQGILQKIPEGVYTLEFSVQNSISEDPSHKFCETFLLEIGISPYSSVESLLEHYSMKSCQDNTQDLKNWFSQLESKLNSDQKVNLKPDQVYLVQGGFSSEFRVPAEAYGYFGKLYLEIFSDFVVSDLTITLQKRHKKKLSIIKGDTSDVKKLGNHNRKAFQELLVPGNYLFTLNKGPTQNTTESLLTCSAFQLRIQIFQTEQKQIQNWNCYKKDAHLLPSSLNTLDKLGTPGTDPFLLPKTVYFSPNVIAPNSYKNVTNSVSFKLQKDSLVRVLAESQGEAMRLVLKQGSKVVATDGSTKTPPIYTLSHKGSADYKLEVLFYPSTQKKCHTYSILIEILPTGLIQESTSNCIKELPSNEIISERTIEYGVPLFFFNTDQGFSSLIESQTFQFPQKTKPTLTTMPLQVTSAGSMVTGHLQYSFVQADLVMEILSGEEVVEWGSFQAPHRYELSPVPLSQGDYTLRIRELSRSPFPSCLTFSTSALVEDVALWDNISALVRKSETCNYPDQSYSLNLVGQLEYGRLHWRKTLEMDLLLQMTVFDFHVDEESILKVFIEPLKGINFRVRVVGDSQADEKLLFGAETFETSIKGGSYNLEIRYESETFLPPKNSCPSFVMDLQVLPKSEFTELSSYFSCGESQEILSMYEGVAFSKDYLLSGPLDHYIAVNLPKDYFFKAYLSYENSLSGSILLELYDLETNLLKSSSGIENISELASELEAGSYLLRLLGTLQKSICYPLSISISSQEVQKADTCLGGVLPPSLVSKEAGNYGKQNKDGSVSFHGVFGIRNQVETEVIEISGIKPSIARFMTMSHNPQILIESALYKDTSFHEPVGYSRSGSSVGSFILEIPPQKTPYYLVLTYIYESTSEDCNTFDLKIVIETKQEVSNMLQCKLESHNDLLPQPTVNVKSKGEVHGSDTYAIMGSWINGENLPKGVTSSSPFVFETELSFSVAGVLSAEVNFDFLTNDLSLQLKKQEKTVATSQWDLLSDDELGEVFNFASVLEGVEVEPGTYQLKLKQAIASAHLVERHPEISVCFPFLFNFEFIPSSSLDETMSTLLLVEPDQKTHHNAKEDLKLTLDFQKPLPSSKDLQNTLFLLNERNEQVYPSHLIVAKNSPNKLKATFRASKLKAGTCYELNIQAESLKVSSDHLRHVYCTTPCLCNPKAEAVCNKKMQCVCPYPYTGPTCHECLEGYEQKDWACIELPLPSKLTKATLNVESPVQLGHQVKALVEFSSTPYTSEGSRITSSHQNLFQEAFSLVGPNQITPNFVAPFNKNLTKWRLEFEPDLMESGATYQLTYSSGFFYDEQLSPIKSYLELPSFTTVQKDLFLKDCKNGVLVAGKCSCSLGYSGKNCNECAEGFERTDSDECKLVETPSYEVQSAKDPEAFVVDVEPKKLSYVSSEETEFKVVVQLSKQAYTNEGLLIDNFTNKEYLLKVFMLQKTKSKVLLKPSKVAPLDEKGLDWEVHFATKKLNLDRDYKFVQVGGLLYTSKGDLFSPPSVAFPVFRVTETLHCSFKQEKIGNTCVCKQGYAGENCELCSGGYRRVEGVCLSEELSSEQNWTATAGYCLMYLGVGLLFIWLVNKFRKMPRNQGYEPVELEDRSPGSNEIDLYRFQEARSTEME